VSFLVTSIKITGTPGASGWSQVHEFKPDDPEKLNQRGHLFAVVAAAPQAGRELILRIQEEYFGALETTAFYALKSTVQKVTDEFAKKEEEVEVAAAVVLKEVVYSAAGGGGRVEIYREGNMAKILESALPAQAGASGVVCASGYPKSGDQIILGTKSFFRSVSAGIIKAALEGPDPQAAVESLASVIHANPNSGNIGCVIIKFAKTFLHVPETVVNPVPEIKSKTTLFFKRLFFSLVKALPERKIFVKRASLNESVGVGRKNTLLVGAILLVLLLVSIGFGIRQNRTRKFKAGYQDILIQAKDQLVQAQNLASSDPAQARTLFTDSQAKIKDLVVRKINDKEVTDLKKQIDEKEGRIMGIYRPTPELYLDLSLLSSGFEGERMIASGDNLYVLDKAGKRVVGVVLATKKTNVLAGPDQADGVLDILAYEDDVYGVFDDGVYLLGNKKEKVIDKDWQKDVLAYAYAGNIYILDKEAGGIWRYQSPPTGGGSFGPKQNWLAAGTKPDFTNAKQIFIDGAVWVLSEPFKISKFSLGSPQAFSSKGVFPEITNAAAIYSNEENKYIYLLDKEGGRIVVLEKIGNYKAQYQSDKFKEGTGIIVSEKTSKAVILTKEKLIQVDLKHL